MKPDMPIYIVRDHSIRMKEIYWLAGLLEGEGAFLWGKLRNNPRVTFTSTDLDITARVAGLFRKTLMGPYFHKEGRIGKKPYYMAEVTGPRAIGWMMTLYTLMGGRRKEDIKRIVSIFNDHVFLKRRPSVIS